MKTTAVGFLLILAGSTFAATPTTWQFENKTSMQITITCEGAAPGLGRKLTQVIKVKPTENATIQWTDHTNDGMGLNAAAWQCDAKTHNLSGSLTFSTDWGENIFLSVEKPNSLNLALTKFTKTTPQ